jgi:hypothetical protein
VDLSEATEPPRESLPPPPDGFLCVLLDPRADLFIDGEARGTGVSRRVERMPSDRPHRVEVRRDDILGVQVWPEVEVPPGDTLFVRHEFALGKLRVASGRSLALVWIDGKYMGETPLSRDVAAGSHRVSAEGKESQVTGVEVRVGQEVEQISYSGQGAVAVDVPEGGSVLMLFSLSDGQ